MNQQNNKKVTIVDVAREAGVSAKTVSRVVNGNDYVSDVTRAIIEDAIDKLGYRPNHIARQLQSQRTQTIGFIMPTRYRQEQDDFFSILLKGITYTATQHHYDVLISVESEVNDLEVYKRMAGGNRVDAMIIARTYRDDARIAYLQSINFPFIVHGRLTPDIENHFPYIDMDSQEGIALLTQHLIKNGHQEIGLILPPENAAFTPYRLAGYKNTIEASVGFDDNRIIYSDLTYAGGQVAMQSLFNRNPNLTAVIGCNDWMALGAMAIAQQRGHQIGKNFSVVGYDDIILASYSDPPLTTIHQPIFDIGTQLADTLITEILTKKPTVEIPQRLIEPKLIVRASSGQAPQRKE